jgi:predicted unusual protein kinase regulating ubiquinone biosynthesis (AarF/ABC1/UbiB family)
MSKAIAMNTLQISKRMDLCRVHQVEIDPAMANIVISTLVLEGLGRSLASDLNLLDFALPFVLKLHVHVASKRAGKV